jgi:hypothetical protein
MGCGGSLCTGTRRFDSSSSLPSTAVAAVDGPASSSVEGCALHVVVDGGSSKSDGERGRGHRCAQ